MIDPLLQPIATGSRKNTIWNNYESWRIKITNSMEMKEKNWHLNQTIRPIILPDHLKMSR